MDPRAAEDECRMLVRRIVPKAEIYFPRGGVGLGLHLDYSWDGKDLRPTGATIESQLHEIAHLLLASPERLEQPEFGLGPDPYRRWDVPRTIPKEEADLEELHTCWMQLLLTRVMELDAAAVRYEYELEPLTAAMVTTLRATYPGALPEDWWDRAQALFE